MVKKMTLVSSLMLLFLGLVQSTPVLASGYVGDYGGGGGGGGSGGSGGSSFILPNPLSDCGSYCVTISGDGATRTVFYPNNSLTIIYSRVAVDVYITNNSVSPDSVSRLIPVYYKSDDSYLPVVNLRWVNSQPQTLFVQNAFKDPVPSYLPITIRVVSATDSSSFNATDTYGNSYNSYLVAGVPSFIYDILKIAPNGISWLLTLSNSFSGRFCDGGVLGGLSIQYRQENRVPPGVKSTDLNPDEGRPYADLCNRSPQCAACAEQVNKKLTPPPQNLQVESKELSSAPADSSYIIFIKKLPYFSNNFNNIVKSVLFNLPLRDQGVLRSFGPCGSGYCARQESANGPSSLFTSRGNGSVDGRLSNLKNPNFSDVRFHRQCDPKENICVNWVFARTRDKGTIAISVPEESLRPGGTAPHYTDRAVNDLVKNVIIPTVNQIPGLPGKAVTVAAFGQYASPPRKPVSSDPRVLSRFGQPKESLPQAKTLYTADGTKTCPKGPFHFDGKKFVC